MLKQIYISILLSFAAFGGFSQSQSEHLMDSLYTEWQQNPNDTLRLHALMWMIDIMRDEHQIDSAYHLSLLAKDFAKKMGYTKMLAYSYEYLGEFSHVISNYDSALHYDLQALTLYTQLGDSSGIAKSLNSIGEDHLDREFYSMAYDYYYRAYNAAESIKDSLIMTIAYYNMGRVLKEQGHYERALTFINTALEMSKDIGDEEGVAYAHFDIGEIYMMLGRYQDSRDKLESALEISQTLSTYVLIPQIYNKLGELNEVNNNYEDAIINYQEALNYYRRHNNKFGIGESYRGLGSVYSEKGNYSKAEEFFKECLKLAGDVESVELKSKCYLELSELFDKKGHAEKAFDYFKKYKASHDSLFNSKKSEQLAQMQMEHLTQQKNLEVELLTQREVQQQERIKQEEFIRNILVVIVAFFIVLLISLYRSSARRKKMNNLLMIQQQELEQHRSELVELNKVKDKFFSIISHDLRSPINNLAGMSALLTDGNLTKDETITLSKSIQKQLRHASKLLDNLMDWVLLQSNEIKIRKENINLYHLVNENIEFFNDLNDKGLTLVNNVQDIEVLADKNMLDLIIRNLMSNAIKFTENGGRVEVSSLGKGDQVTVSISDTGIGVPEEMKPDLFDFKSHYSRKGTANEKGTGLGLKLCKEFVERNGGQIWMENNEGKGSSFKFTLQRATSED